MAPRDAEQGQSGPGCPAVRLQCEAIASAECMAPSAVRRPASGMEIIGTEPGQRTRSARCAKVMRCYVSFAICPTLPESPGSWRVRLLCCAALFPELAVPDGYRPRGSAIAA